MNDLIRAIIGVLLAGTTASAAVKANQLVSSARSQIGVTVSYDPAYRKLAYPGGDAPRKVGVCSDVIIRALREQSIDLQKELHEDMERDFAAYPKKWGLKKSDPNIDHRRVLNLMTYFERHGYARPLSAKPEHFAPGDIVAWDLGQGITHIGLVSNRTSSTGTPLIIHNIGAGTQEEDVLQRFRVIGHYRLK